MKYEETDWDKLKYSMELFRIWVEVLKECGILDSSQKEEKEK